MNKDAGTTKFRIANEGTDYLRRYSHNLVFAITVLWVKSVQCLLLQVPMGKSPEKVRSGR
jgi:hypothetical protein